MQEHTSITFSIFAIYLVYSVTYTTSNLYQNIYTKIYFPHDLALLILAVLGVVFLTEDLRV